MRFKSFAVGLAGSLISIAMAWGGLAAEDFPGKQSDWNGYKRFDFEVDGRAVLVVAPKTAAPGRPWVWHGEFFGHKPAPDVALLGRGFHIVYMRVPNLLGSPVAVRHWNQCYEAMTGKYGLAERVALVGLSRGGLYCYNWAAANPNRVACIYGDAPVCDFKSWPGGKGKGKGSPNDWRLVLKTYGFKDEAEALAYTKNPIDQLEPLAQAKVPLLHVYGDADSVVPWDENTGLLAQRYRKLGGSIQLIAKPGVGHHPHGLEDSSPIVDFISGHCLAEPEPYRLRVLSYNIHHGEGVDRKLDLPRIARVILSVTPDLVALQEVDQRTKRTGEVDQAAELARLTGMQVVFGPNIDFEGGKYGNAVLSRHPLRRRKNHALPNLNEGEQRGLLEVEVELPGKLQLRMLATHLDHRGPDDERFASAQVINRLVFEHDTATLLLGDLNDVPDSRTLTELAGSWKRTNQQAALTVPVDVPKRQIDYVLYRPAARWEVVETKVLDERVASDHRAILAVLKLKRP